MKEAIEEVTNNDNEKDWWDDLTLEEQNQLETSIQESFDPKNWISHNEVMKKYENRFNLLVKN